MNASTPIEQVLGRVLGVDPDSLSDESGQASLPTWDSLRHLEVIAALEEIYGLRFTAREILAIRSVGDARRLLGRSATKAAGLIERRLRWRALGQKDASERLKIAILSTFTANPIEPYLGTALDVGGTRAEIIHGPYNQIAQQCLGDASETARFEPRIVVVWPRLEDLWGAAPLPLVDDDPASYATEALELADIALDASRRWRATLVWVLPAIPLARPLGVGDACSKGVHATAAFVRAELRDRLLDQRGVVLVDAEEAIRRLGARNALDPAKDAVARVPYSEEAFCFVADQVARVVQLGEGRARKLVVLDGDGTLWGGVLGEDGAEGVDLYDNGPGHAYRAFQAHLLELRRAGVLLALCSKNDEADVWRVLERPEMRLRKEHLAAHRIGWNAKSQSIREIAAELGLGLDAVAVIDDSPVELAEIQSALPEVACIRMPAEPEDWFEAVCAPGVLDRLRPTHADLARAKHYSDERARTEALAHATSPEAYRAKLGVVVSIGAPGSGDIARLAQLVGKTNQFNMNCKRRTEAEIAALCDDPQYLVRIASARDRFGDYGVVGVYIVRVERERGTLDTLLLSCRALGRAIEHAMIADAFEELGRRSIATLVAITEECPRNEPARRFFAELGCTSVGAPTDLRRPAWPAYVQRAGAATTAQRVEA